MSLAKGPVNYVKLGTVDIIQVWLRLYLGTVPGGS